VRKPGASLTLAVVAAAALALAACGGGDDDEAVGESADPAAATDNETTTTEDPRQAREADVVAAYEASWNDFIKAGDPPSPDAEFLANHLSGEALTVSRNLLNALKAEGVVLRGTYDFDARVTDLADDRAVVEDCGLDLLQVVEPTSGEVVEDNDDERDGLVAELTLEGGSWKVISYTDDAQVCA
jgi:hypothetical protein